MSKDYYAILGVSRDASQGDISEAYRKLALQHHPDRNPGDEEAVQNFKDAAEAFEVLNSPDKRAHYDQFGVAPGQQRGPGRAPPGFGSFGFNFNDFFGERTSRKVVNLKIDLPLSFKEAAEGCVKEVEITRKKQCKVCKGTGAKKWRTCDVCGGTGHQMMRQGPFAIQMQCGACGGVGKHPEEKCDKCSGGLAGSAKDKVSITVPGGVENGMRIRLQGEGDYAPGVDTRGDLFVTFRVDVHPLYVRKGADIMGTIPVSFTQLVFGDTISVPTLSGSTSFAIPPGTPSGRIIRLNGLGAMHVNAPGRRGNLLLKVQVETPAKLSKDYETCLKTLQGIEEKTLSPNRQRFKDLVKSIEDDPDWWDKQ